MPAELRSITVKEQATVNKGFATRPVFFHPQPGIAGLYILKDLYTKCRQFVLHDTVGLNARNNPDDVMTIYTRLVEIGMAVPDISHLLLHQLFLVEAIKKVQRHFMETPTGLIAPNDLTHKILMNWSEKTISPEVNFGNNKLLREAWRLVSPCLPPGSYCSSAYRSEEEQRRILHKFFTKDYRDQIIKKYGQEKYNSVSQNLIKNEADVLMMVRGVGQAIAAPGKSMHQQGKAIDIGGPYSIDDEQVRVVKLVAKAHPLLFSGYVLKERNGCVHFEIR